ncbi:lysosomal alpha-glucosidase-like isoform X1 [Leptidea sinapis]|uniref:lysosomal alpha-glucosidase-like isoform X1 n=2 Tax=Leptidea sinapis TaxID=189913 RepID=UPI00214180F5|nr:lysosomal alpha-glucosidase-like isoform X1 [Leptidea sinapis]
MPKIPYKTEKNEEENEDYEIVSFEDFCDKSPTVNVDLLTLNDNINYRLHYESGKDFKSGSNEPAGTSASIETALDAPQSNSHQRKRPSFTPFGKIGKSRRGSLFSGVIPKPKNESDSGHREHRYERFSQKQGRCNNILEQLGSLLPGMLVGGLLCALGIATWWAVAGALAGGWGDDHYRRLWERVHPEEVKKPLTPLTLEKPVITEYRYHDHNNLSTKNRGNLTTNKKDVKKAFMERSPEVMKELCARIVNDNMRFDCYPQDGASEEACVKRGCCWKPATTQNAPYCFYPPQYESYQFTNSTENKHGMSVYYTRSFDTGYPGQFAIARIDFNYLSDDILQVKITDAENKRFESPYPEVPMVFRPLLNMKYRVQVDSSVVGFKVIRNSDNVTIWDAQNVGGLVLSDKFLQLSTVLPTNYTYGFGEKQSRFLNDMRWQTHTLFNSDTPPTENVNLYGTHPFYLALESNGNSHGVFLLNSNAIDIVLQPTPAITYRTIGGILNFYMMLGPTPQQVITQYTEVIGKPFMPPYWSLGFHLCKYNYGSLNVTRDVWQKNRDAEIPFDVQWNDLDYMSKANDFTYDHDKYAELPQFVRQLHGAGMHYVLLFDPGVSASENPGEYPPFDRGLEMNVFIKNSTDQPFVGKVWNRKTTVWPDFTHPNSTAYWKEMFADFHKLIPFDGAWIDMNEPSNFLSGPMFGQCLPEQLSYSPRQLAPEGLRHKTLCMDAAQYAGSHYDLHNVYGLSETVATHTAMTEVVGKRPLIISRSSFPGSGHYAGHWSGDVFSRWHDLRASVPQLLSMSLFGIPMMGADICGFRGDTTPELCLRWMQLGAFYPFSRNHNSDTSKPQDPVSMGEAVVSASRSALRLRYALLPVYYTLFWRANVLGQTVARPLFFSFPRNQKVYDIDEQFMIGDHLMVTGIMQEGANTTSAYFPGPNPWYNVRDGRLLATDTWKVVGENETVAVKGGAILPMQEASEKGPVNTANTRSRPLQLLVVPDRAGVASGELYWDDGESLNSYEEKKYSYIVFKLKDNELFSKIHWWGWGVPVVNTIRVYGQNYPVNTITINNDSTHFTQDAHNKVLTIPDISLSLDKEFYVKWTYKKMVPKI